MQKLSTTINIEWCFKGDYNFEGLNNLPQIAASTFGDGSTSGSNRPSSSGSTGDGLLDNFVDNLAGMIAQAIFGG